LSRRQFLSTGVSVAAVAAMTTRLSQAAAEGVAPAIALGSRRELFVDGLLIDKLSGNAALRLARPHDEGNVLAFDRPWEGPFCGYVTVLRDGDLYRTYYRGHPLVRADGSDSEVTCCAESKDGIHWTKPNLGLFEVGGSRDNNVILAGMAPFSHNFS